MEMLLLKNSFKKYYCGAAMKMYEIQMDNVCTMWTSIFKKNFSFFRVQPEASSMWKKTIWYLCSLWKKNIKKNPKKCHLCTASASEPWKMETLETADKWQDAAFLICWKQKLLGDLS